MEDRKEAMRRVFKECYGRKPAGMSEEQLIESLRPHIPVSCIGKDGKVDEHTFYVWLMDRDSRFLKRTGGTAAQKGRRQFAPISKLAEDDVTPPTTLAEGAKSV